MNLNLFGGNHACRSVYDQLPGRKPFFTRLEDGKLQNSVGSTTAAFLETSVVHYDTANRNGFIVRNRVSSNTDVVDIMLRIRTATFATLMTYDKF